MKHIQNRWADTQMRPHLPLGCDQQGRYPEAAHAASELDDAEPPQTLTDRIVDWLTPVRFWKLYRCAIFGAILLVWWLA